MAKPARRLNGETRAAAPPPRGALGRPDGWGATAVYGSAHLGKSLFWYGGEILFAYFLTDVAGFPPTAMAFIVAAGFLVSAAVDLIVGAGLPRLLASAGRAGRLQLAGAAACAVTLLTFLATPFVPEPARLAFALVTGVALRVAYAFYDVPQNALMALATESDSARSRVAFVRIAASGLATLLVAAGVGPILAVRATDQENGLILTFGAAAAAFGLASAMALTKVLGGGEDAPNLAPASYLRLGPLGRLPPAFWLFVAMMVAMSLAPPLFNKLEPYFAIHVLGSARWGGAIVLALAWGLLVGQPLWYLLSRRLSRPDILLIAAGVHALGAISFLVMPVDQPAALVAAGFVIGLGNGGLGMTMWAGFSDQLARAPAMAQGPASALFVAASKISLACGVFLVAAVLEGALQTGELRRMVLAMTAGPVAGSLAVAILALALRRILPR